MSDSVFKPIISSLNQISADIPAKKYKGLLHKHSQDSLLQRLDRERRNLNNELSYAQLQRECINKEQLQDVTNNHRHLLKHSDRLENRIQNREPTNLERLTGAVIDIAGFLSGS
jgi:uncharacterized membrane protein YgaE (UPF0421/DUF939 family)